MTYQQILEVSGLSDQEVHKACGVGSQVYGTATEDSDHDYVVILGRDFCRNELIRHPKINVTIQSFGHFKDGIAAGNIFAHEVLWAPRDHVFKDSGLKLPLATRRNIIESAVEKADSDFKKGVKLNNSKRIYHAFRVLDFAIQLVDFGTIRDFTRAQYIYETIMTEPGLFRFDFLQSFHTRVLELTSKMDP